MGRETEGAVKTSLESRTPRHGAEIAPGGNRGPSNKNLGTKKDEVIGKIKTRPDKVPTLLTCQAGSGCQQPHVLIP